jgi:hypothetical protein
MLSHGAQFCPTSPILRGSAATIPPLDCDLPFSLHFPHHPYNNRPPFQYTNVPIHFCKNLQPKKSLIKPLPPLPIYTMPTKKSKAQSITNNGSGTKVPSSTTVLMRKLPSELLQMSSAAYALAKCPQTKSKVNALYPPIGHHPSKPTTLLFRNGKSQATRSTSRPHQKNTQNSSSQSNSVGSIVDKTLPCRGRSPTPMKLSVSTFNPGPLTASTLSLTQGSSTVKLSKNKQQGLTHLRSISQLNTRHS